MVTSLLLHLLLSSVWVNASPFAKSSSESNLVSGQRVEEWNSNSEVNPEELGEYLEGDIITSSSRNGLISEDKRWPKGEVPYEISGAFNQNEISKIKRAMEHYHKSSCIRFKRRTPDDPDWISITSEKSGCWSLVGRKGGKQSVNLQNPNCLVQIGTILHELLHAVGFHHEQNRSDRDNFVTIIWDNIKKGKESNFAKVGGHVISDFGVPYDYGSVLHYSEKAFSNNKQTTIFVNQKTNSKIGQRDGFSERDLEKLRLMYNCGSAFSQNYTVGEVAESNVDRDNNFIGGLVSHLFPSRI